LWATLAIVALRLAIGWHFYKEGTKKFKDPEFSSAFLFQAAVGPWSNHYRQQIPDRWGERRLNPAAVVGDADQPGDWDRYVEQAGRHYGFDEDQRRQAQGILASAEKSYLNYLNAHAEEIAEYTLQLDHLLEQSRRPMNQQIDFARQRLADKETELRSKVTPWLKDISAQYRDLERRISELASLEQRGRGVLRIGDPARSRLDEAVKWVITGAGVLLMLGLFTRLAAVVAAAFLLSVMGTQPPWVPDANLQYFYYQFVEFWALMVLVAFAAGRYAGLDFILAGLWSRRETATSDGRSVR
jgi:uncharacterized membrane protein YphA (DoxX/SURF4 family)